MSGFAALSGFSAVLVLFTGLATSIAAYGIGSLLMKGFPGSDRPVWCIALRFLAGLLVLGLAVQLLAMMYAAAPRVLKTLWILFTASGCFFAVKEFGAHKASWNISWIPRDGFGITSALIFLVSGFTNLLIALNPSTKIDEIHYHMLTPARVVADQGLRFYAAPLEGALIPQLFFHIAFAPFHALGAPDAGNVVNWSASMLLALTASFATLAISRSASWAMFAAALIVTGIYPAVNHVTSAAHAIGDLAVCSTVIALFWLFNGSKSRNSMPTALEFGVLTVAAAATKVSLLPMAVGLHLVALTHIIGGQEARKRARTVAFSFLPWIVFYVPILIWTTWASGSPFGSMLTEIFPSKIFAPGEAGRAFAASLKENQVGLEAFLRDAVIGIPIIVWPLIVVFLVWFRSRKVAIPLGLIFLIQGLIIATSLPHQARFFGGLHYGLAILGTAAIAEFSRRQPLVKTIAILCIAPWMAAQIYYARPFLLAHLPGKRADFQARYIPMLADFTALDGLLPENSQLLFSGVRGPSIYAPRRVVYDTRDLRPGDRAYLFHVEPAGTTHLPPRGLAPATRIYANEASQIYTFRRPGVPPMRGRVTVYPLNGSEP